MTLTAATETPKSYRTSENPEAVNFLIVRQAIFSDILQYSPNVKWLQLLNAGFEKVDLDLFRRRQILFTNARSVYCATIAENGLAKILLLARTIPSTLPTSRRASGQRPLPCCRSASLTYRSS